jgi:RNA polymerase sporulation-specific sigma factor
MCFENVADEQLIALAKENNTNAIDELFNRYRYVILSVARSYFLSGGDTEDLLQEGMLAAFKAINTFNGKSSFNSYLYLCVKNRILSVIKSSNRFKNQPLNNYISLSGVVDGDIDKSEVIIDGGYGPEEKYINEETASELVCKIKNSLSDYEYEILTLYLKGYSQKEIGERLNKKDKSVDNALQRIKKKILTLTV